MVASRVRSGVRCRESGFTLVELIVTLLIVGILAVFVAARMDSFGAFGERGFHDALKGGLQFARKEAVAKRRYTCVAVAGNAVGFTLDTRSPETGGAVFCDGSGAADLNLPAPDRNCPGTNQVCAPAGRTASCAPAVFSFDAQGRASAAVTCSSSGQPDIRIEQETGYVH